MCKSQGGYSSSDFAAAIEDWLQARGDARVPDVPDLRVPDVGVPDLRFPDVGVPEFPLGGEAYCITIII